MTMPDSMFIDLSPSAVEAFRAWARTNYTPGDEVNELWHPVARDECARMNTEAFCESGSDGSAAAPRFTEIKIGDGGFRGRDARGGLAPGERMMFSARFDLFLIRQAWDQGVDFEDLADGYGPGLGTMGGDWSGVRDSGTAAVEAMLERALNHLFPTDR